MPNKKQATKKSIQEAKVQQLDNIGTDINAFIQQESLSIVEDILGDFIERVHENINQTKDFVTTGKINEITIQGQGNVVNVMAYPHLIYQDRGVNGAIKKLYNTEHQYTDKMPPVSVFKQWIKDKNIRAVNNHKLKGEGSPFEHMTEEQQINSRAWAFAKSIYKFGYKPKHIFSKEIPKLIDDLTEALGDFTIQCINQVIDVKPSAKRTIIKK